MKLRQQLKKASCRSSGRTWADWQDHISCRSSGRNRLPALPVLLTGNNTVFLNASSFTYHAAEVAVKRASRKDTAGPVQLMGWHRRPAPSRMAAAKREAFFMAMEAP